LSVTVKNQPRATIPAALTAQRVGEIVGGDRPYTAETIRNWYRAGKFPAPIDATLPVKSWRWSPRVIERYVDGDAA
jgi:hypothetical protein